MKIYTKQGDTGETSIIGGKKLSKSDQLIGVLGDIDELNASLGVAASFSNDADTREFIRTIQSGLLTLGSELASPDDRWTFQSAEEMTKRMEKWIDDKTDQMEPLLNFVLPGGTQGSATLHYARTVCRRVERSIVALNESVRVRPDVLVFINRLSDWLFCAGRYANHLAGTDDVKWKGGQSC